MMACENMDSISSIGQSCNPKRAGLPNTNLAPCRAIEIGASAFDDHRSSGALEKSLCARNRARQQKPQLNLTGQPYPGSVILYVGSSVGEL
jgi:hypothetical protein